VPYNIQAWYSILPRLSSPRVSPESSPSEISGREMDEVVVYTCTIDVNVTDNQYQYQHLHMGNCACMSCSVQRLYWASRLALVARCMRGVDHCWIPDR